MQSMANMLLNRLLFCMFKKTLTVGQFLRNCCTYVEAEPKRQAL